MSDTIVGALIGAFASLFVGGLASFAAERYRSHRDAIALAGGLAGELASYTTAWPLLRTIWSERRDRAAGGELLHIPSIARPTDRVFDANAGKIGMLGADLAESVAYVYGNIGAFRSMMQSLSDATTAESQAAILTAALAALERIEPRSRALIIGLKRFAGSEFLETNA